MIMSDGFASERKSGVRVYARVLARARRDMICCWCAFPIPIYKFGPEKEKEVQFYNI